MRLRILLMVLFGNVILDRTGMCKWQLIHKETGEIMWDADGYVTPSIKYNWKGE